MPQSGTSVFLAGAAVIALTAPGIAASKTAPPPLPDPRIAVLEQELHDIQQQLAEIKGAPDFSAAVLDLKRSTSDQYADITNQLASVPPKITPSVSAIHLGGCKLLIARWEADAFKGNSEPLRALQRAVAARTILHVSMERFRRNEATDLDAAVEIGQRLAEEMKSQVQRARDSSNIDAAVNLSATAKRLIALVEQGQKLRA